MLFPYKYVPHVMDRMQRFINFIFYEVWCKAPKSGAFRLELFDSNPALKEVMTTFHYSDKKNADFFNSHIEGIYQLFANLNRTEIKQFKRWYQGNNNIQKVCANDPATYIVRYDEIPLKHDDLKKQLKSFFMGLYDEVGIAALKEKIGDIADHYKEFIRKNAIGKCPFCGINDMLGVYHTHREAYDHYLPKNLYPFNSINFRNLVPACHHCNSSYKASKNPAFTPKDPTRAVHRRKVFYPYANPGHHIEVTINLSNPDIDRLTPNEIQLTFGPAEVYEEIETWKDVYGIEERYRGKLLDGDGKAWFVEVCDEWRWKDESAGAEGRSPDEYLRDLRRHAAKSRFTGANFLKMAFLEGCQRKGNFTINYPGR